MATRVPVGSVLVVGALLGSVARGIVEEGGVAPPWAGWHWPMYCPELVQCPYCPLHQHLFSELGPIYDLDTRYFWKPLPQRNQALEWEYENHRYTEPWAEWTGHCSGISYASIIESGPPPGLDRRA
ncbi:hypothetical protein FJY71_01790 [candidate division WOR-3 bacterium]|nr:hypothetical protein [candidate division WOR-3 bacterium]